MSKFVHSSIVEVYLTELQSLWEQRTHAVRDSDYFVNDLERLDERIAAHADGLVVALQEDHSYVASALGAGEHYAVFAAAYPLLRCDTADHAALVLNAFLAAEGPALLGFRDAFCHGPTRHTLSGLREVSSSHAGAAAAIANECVVFHGHAGCDRSRWFELVQHDDPMARAACWRSLMWRSEAGSRS